VCRWVPDVGEGVDPGQRARCHRALPSLTCAWRPAGSPIRVRIPPSGIWYWSMNGTGFDAMAKVRPREGNGSGPRPPRRGVAGREGFLVRLVDEIANRQWLCGFAHRTANRLILIDRDGGARTGCAVGLHESYDGRLRRMATAFVRDAPPGGLDSRSPRRCGPTQSRRRRATGRGASRSSRLRAVGMRPIPAPRGATAKSAQALVSPGRPARTRCHRLAVLRAPSTVGERRQPCSLVSRNRAPLVTCPAFQGFVGTVRCEGTVGAGPRSAPSTNRQPRATSAIRMNPSA
jgi:hypothetical protein